jgi:hypothetical protein
VEEQKEKVIERLEKLHQNLDTGMTRDRYLDLCEQMGNKPIEDEIPPDWDDFPEIVNICVATFNQLGDRVQADIGYIGKDYTNVNQFMDLYGVDDKEFFFRLLSFLDNRAIKKSSEELKRQHDKLKRQSSGKRSQTNIKG